MKYNKLFIAYTPFHNFFIEKIIVQKKLDNYLIANFKDKIIITSSHTKRLRYIDVFIYILRINNFKDVVIPHNLGILTNYIYFNYAGNLNYFYEGVMYIRKSEYIMPVSEFRRRLFLSFLFGFIYKKAPMYDLKDRRTKKLFYPEGLNSDFKNVSRIKFQFSETDYASQYNNEQTKSVVLILGQLVDIANYNEYADDFICLVNSISDYQILYKPHPHELKMGYFKNLPSISNVSIIESSEIAENIVLRIKPEKVISWASSALLNLKLVNSSLEVYTLVKNNEFDDIQLELIKYGVKTFNI
ncbi:MAG: hypothetical protein JJU28_06970 [Cyclobacteriaceae bacterium]|nr:hypothetical protein [Cyclobacteriaceae bacterium]